MKKQPKYSPEVMERAVRMVNEAGGQYESQWAAITSLEWREDKVLDSPRCMRDLAKVSHFPLSGTLALYLVWLAVTRAFPHTRQ